MWAEKTSGKKKNSKALAIISAVLLIAVLLGPVEGSSLAVVETIDSTGVTKTVGNEADAELALSTVASPQASTSDSGAVGLCINEFMALNHAAVPGPNGTFPDWIELYNAGNESVNLSGMYLTDDPTFHQFWQFPNGTFLAAKQFIVIWADRSTDQNEFHAGFALNATGGVIGLFASDGATLLDSMSYSIQIRDVSYGRVRDGSSTWAGLLIATPGASNVLKSAATLAEEVATWIFIVAILSVCVAVAIKFKLRKEGNNKIA